MAGVEVDSSLLSQCLDFCQALARQGHAFNLSVAIGASFTFSLDTRSKTEVVPVKKKKVSPSTQRRNARRREEFLLKKRQRLSTVDAPVEKATVPQFSCDQCDYTNVSEKGLRQHIRMKHRREQLENQLQKSSSPATPESLRCSTGVTSLFSSPPLHSSREETCPNCDGSLTSDHQCDSESDCDEEDDDDEEEQIAEGERLKAEREAMYQMLLQINASNPFMKKNSD